MATKLFKYSGIINKLKNYLPLYIRKALYNSLVQTHLNYATLVWDFKCNRLVKLQKRLVRIITCSKYNAHTDPLFKNIEILKVSHILDLNALKFYYKHVHGKLPSYFYSFNIVTQGSQHSYNTRQSERIRTERTRAEYCDNRLKIFFHTLLTQSRSTCWKELQLTVSKDSRRASNHISSTCIQLTAPLPPTDIFVTAINSNKYSLLMPPIKMKSPAKFLWNEQNMDGWSHLFSISSNSGGITLTKSLPDISGTTIQYVGPFAPMESGVHTISNELILQISCDISLALKWISMMRSGHNISHHTTAKLSVNVWNHQLIWWPNKIDTQNFSTRTWLRALKP